jgi:hypothetical protein
MPAGPGRGPPAGAGGGGSQPAALERAGLFIKEGV